MTTLYLSPGSRILAGASRSGVPLSKLGKHNSNRITGDHLQEKNNPELTLTIASPARFYVSMAVKMRLIEFLSQYEFKVADEKVPSSFAWGVARLPHPNLAFLVRERST